MELDPAPPSKTPIAAATKIRVQRQPACRLCGQPGDVLYRDLSDRLFSAPGTWNFHRCPDANCGHVWLDPQPIEEDIPLLYLDYFTHGDASYDGGSARSTSLIYRTLKFGYRALLALSGTTEQRRKLFAMFTDDRKPGRLLEVGCGSGERLAHFAARGWRVVGQDVDPKAVEHARAKTGLAVHLGTIETLTPPKDPFDAVVSNHVVEHVSDPVALLREAGKLLSRNGVLVAATPNIESFGHARFGEAWHALDPPRHLNLFSARTLTNIAREAGFEDVRVITTPAHADGIAYASLEVVRAGRFEAGTEPTIRTQLRAKSFHAAAFFRHKLDRNSGEECVLIAERFRD